MLKVGDRVLSTLPESDRKGTVNHIQTEKWFANAPYYVKWDDGGVSICSAESLAPCDPASPEGAQAGPMTVGQLLERLSQTDGWTMPIAVRIGVTDDHGHSEYQCSDLAIRYCVEDGTGMVVIEGKLSL